MTSPLRFHLAIPPVDARSPFSYFSKRYVWCRLRETGKGMKTDGDYPVH